MVDTYITRTDCRNHKLDLHGVCVWCLQPQTNHARLVRNAAKCVADKFKWDTLTVEWELQREIRKLTKV